VDVRLALAIDASAEPQCAKLVVRQSAGEKVANLGAEKSDVSLDSLIELGFNGYKNFHNTILYQEYYE